MSISSANSFESTVINPIEQQPIQPSTSTPTAELFQMLVGLSNVETTNPPPAEAQVSRAVGLPTNQIIYRWDPEQQANESVRGFGVMMAGGLILMGSCFLPPIIPMFGAAGLLIGSEAVTVAFGDEPRGLTATVGVITLIAASMIAQENPAAVLTMLAPVGLHLVTWLPFGDARDLRTARIATLAIALISAGVYYIVGMSKSSLNIGRGLLSTIVLAAGTFVVLGGMRGS